MATVAIRLNSQGGSASASPSRALVLRTRVIVPGEPTPAPDRWVQKQIVGLLRDRRAAHGLSYRLISHDLAVICA